MLKRKGLRSHPVLAAALWRRLTKKGSPCHCLTRHGALGLCPWPPVLTAGTHKCKPVPLFPPPTPPETNDTVPVTREGIWVRQLSPQKHHLFLGDNTSRLRPAIAGIAHQIQNWLNPKTLWLLCLGSWVGPLEYVNHLYELQPQKVVCAIKLQLHCWIP